jgi:hypothetical protein
VGTSLLTSVTGIALANEQIPVVYHQIRKSKTIIELLILQTFLSGHVLCYEYWIDYVAI